MLSLTASWSRLDQRLLVAVSALSGLKAAMLLAVAAVPAWRAELVPPWGLPARAWLPLTVLSAVLYAASGEAARRRRAGGLWFVIAVNTAATLAAAQRLDSDLSAWSLALSLLLIALVALVVLTASRRP